MDRQPYPGAPRWVKVCGVLAVAFVVVFAVMHLAGGGFRHHAPFNSPGDPPVPGAEMPKSSH